MNDQELYLTQRRLRDALLDRKHEAMPGALDMAAHLLLYLDNPARCWQLALDWIRCRLDADRVDGGNAIPWAAYRPVAESLRPDAGMPSAIGSMFDGRDPALHSVWISPRPVMFDDVSQDARFTPQVRKSLASLDTKGKLAVALRDRGLPVGLICCDWARLPKGGNADLYWKMNALATDLLSPIFAASFRIGQDSGEGDPPGAAAGGQLGALELTPGELEVARLIVTGMSYKEIAIKLNRSFSTVDHRLRSIRTKLGARSTSRMIAALSQQLGDSQARTH